MGLYYNGKKVRNLYYNGKCITRLALGKEMTRLVEGDDFVRAEWLCKYIADTSSESDYSNKAVIDTGIAFDDAILISSKIDNSDLVDNAAIGVFDVVNNYSIGVGAVSQTLNFLIVSGPNNHREQSNVTSFKVSKGGFEVNGIPYYNSSVVTLSSNISIAIGALKYTSEYYGNLYRYTTGSFQSKNNGTVKYGALTIYSANTIVADFIPCRLLRPIPATLDGNGIARNADECGMYNSVNGLFYGNVGSGTFTVSDN